MELPANAIAFGEVAALARILPRSDEAVDLLCRQRGLPIFLPAQREYTQHPIEALERGFDDGRVFAAELVVVEVASARSRVIVADVLPTAGGGDCPMQRVPRESRL